MSNRDYLKPLADLLGPDSAQWGSSEPAKANDGEAGTGLDFFGDFDTANAAKPKIGAYIKRVQEMLAALPPRVPLEALPPNTEPQEIGFDPEVMAHRSLSKKGKMPPEYMDWFEQKWGNEEMEFDATTAPPALIHVKEMAPCGADPATIGQPLTYRSSGERMLAPGWTSPVPEGTYLCRPMYGQNLLIGRKALPVFEVVIEIVQPATSAGLILRHFIPQDGRSEYLRNHDLSQLMLTPDLLDGPVEFLTGGIVANVDAGQLKWTTGDHYVDKLRAATPDDLKDASRFGPNPF